MVRINSNNIRKWLRKTLGYFLLLVILPAMFFVVFELALRLADYGYPSHFFMKTEIGGKAYFVNNYKFSWRFFPKSLARLSASLVIPVQKKENVFRVFVLGESAAMGDPDPAFSVSRMLKVMLEKKYPGKEIEIYNTAVTAINSNVIVPIMEDCMEMQPDLFIIYSGNNEVIGPYGISAAFSPFFSHRALVKFKIWFDQTKTGQWIESLSSKSNEKGKEWAGMEMFMKSAVRYDDPRLETVYENFESNLQTICDRASKSKVSVILSTVITNKADCAPFLSLHRQELSAKSLAEWNAYFKQAKLLDSLYKNDEAITYYNKAARIDNDFAELNFRLAKCYLRAGDMTKAGELFSLAQDHDALRFRADSEINEIIRRVAIQFSDEGVSLADAQSCAQQLCKDGVIGSDFMYEHVHLNPKGNFILANCLLQHTEDALGLDPVMEVVSFEATKASLAYSPYDQVRIAEINLSRIRRPPFSLQFGNQLAIGEIQSSIDTLYSAFDSVAIQKMSDAYSAAVSADSSDWFMRLNYLKFLHHFDFYNDAYREAIALAALLPYEYIASVNVGVTAKSLNRFSESEAGFKRAIEINPYFSEAYRSMATLYEAQRLYNKAAESLMEGGCASQEMSEWYNKIGVIFGKQNNADSAITYFRSALKLNPNFSEAKANLQQAFEMKRNGLPLGDPDPASTDFAIGYKLMGEGKPKEAISFFERAIETNAQNPKTHNNLGIAFAQINNLEKARLHFVKATELDPKFFEAFLNLGRLLALQGRHAESVEALNKALLIKSDPELFAMLSAGYSQLKDTAKAREFSIKAGK